MKQIHDDFASEIRQENHSKIWYQKSIELLDNSHINFGKVIDIGAGKGEFLELIKKKFEIKNLSGIDYINSDIKTLKSKRIKAYKIDLDDFQIEKYKKLKNKFDLITCLATAEHIFDLDNLFRFCHYLLEDKGYLLISVPNMDSWIFKFFYLFNGFPYEEGHHIRFLTPKRLNQMAFFGGFDEMKNNNYFVFENQIIARTFGINNQILIKILLIVFFGISKIFSKLHIFDSFTNNGLVVLFQKNGIPFLGIQKYNLVDNFSKLSPGEKRLWHKRFKQFYQKDKLKEHIFLKKYVRDRIK